LTSFPTAKPPVGSGAFQLRPNAVRSTTGSSSRPSRELPSQGDVRAHAAACDEVIGAHLSAAELEDLAGLLGQLPGVDSVDASACSGS
jgi:hypothetical protein